MAIKDIFKKSEKPSSAEALKGKEKKTKAKPEAQVLSVPEKELPSVPKTIGATADKKKKTDNAYGILVKPLVTEKATHLGTVGKYVFEVSSRANKTEIKKAIFDIYGKNPLAVNIVKMRGKKVRYGKGMGQRKNRKKAIISLAPGETIQIYEGV